jgi:hypothetical protein
VNRICASSVGTSRPAVRWNSGKPSSDSAWRNVFDTEGWEMLSARAAPLTEPLT